jgi:hypothetical protein
MSVAIFPLAYIVLSVKPLELSITISLLIEKLAFINSRGVYLNPSDLQIISKNAFKYFTIFYQNSNALLVATYHLSKEKLITSILDKEIWTFK